MTRVSTASLPHASSNRDGHIPPSDTSRELAGVASFQDLVAASVAAQAAAVESDTEAIRAELAGLSRRFVALDRQLLALSHSRVDLEEPERVVESATEEFLRILRAPGVHAAEVAGNGIQVRTHPVRVEWRGSTYDLGEYRITLGLDGETRIESISQLGPKPYWDHPHVQNRLPCLGNLREGILKLIAGYELALATQVLVDFLQTYNPDTAYTPIEGWPQSPC